MYSDGFINTSGASYLPVHSQCSSSRYIRNGAHEQLPSSNPRRSDGKRSRIPPDVKHVITNIIPSGWLNGCHSINLSSCSLNAKSGFKYVVPPPWKHTGTSSRSHSRHSGSYFASCHGLLSHRPGSRNTALNPRSTLRATSSTAAPTSCGATIADPNTWPGRSQSST